MDLHTGDPCWLMKNGYRQSFPALTEDSLLFICLKGVKMYFFAISWQSVIAGTITALAISIVMAVLGVALGFTVVKPRSDRPTSGLGTAFGIWGIISVLVSLAAGGFVAGVLLPVKGAEHGFMVWAVVLVVAALFGGVAVGTAVRMVGSVVQGLGSGAATVASTVGATIGDGVSRLAEGAMEHIPKQIGLKVDFEQWGDTIGDTLKDTGIETLQPHFLQEKFREAKTDLRGTLARLRFDSGSFDRILSDFLGKQNARFGEILQGIDREAAVNALMKKRGMPKEEAQELVDDAIAVYAKAIDKAKTAIFDAKIYIKEVQKQMEDAADQARIAAEKFSSSMAKSALAAALALILGAVVCIYAGHCGNEYSKDYMISVERIMPADIPFDAADDRPRAGP